MSMEISCVDKKSFIFESFKINRLAGVPETKGRVKFYSQGFRAIPALSKASFRLRPYRTVRNSSLTLRKQTVMLVTDAQKTK